MQSFENNPIVKMIAQIKGIAPKTAANSLREVIIHPPVGRPGRAPQWAVELYNACQDLLKELK